MKSELQHHSLQTDCVPGSVDYTVLLPPGYEQAKEPLPLLLNLHGGGLDCNFLADLDMRALYEKLWAEGTLPPMVVACYSARGGWHLNYKDGSERWEDFAFEFIDQMRANYRLGEGPAYTYLTGISMGAMGAMRLVLKYPDQFGAVSAMEGVINPVLNYDDLQVRNYGMQHNLPAEEQAKRWGWPVDRSYYHANNHANIADNNAANIREHAPGIYLEAGDRDYFNAHEGAEFLHRVLWDRRIEHEYRLLHRCDHVGASFAWRIADAHRFLGRMASTLINPTPLPKPTPVQQDFMEKAFKGLVTEPPTAEQTIGLFDDAAIHGHRDNLPAFIADYANDPTGGVFRKP